MANVPEYQGSGYLESLWRAEAERQSSDAHAFLRAIIEAPDDDAPRLVFADWLDDRGEASRAAFIRWQCGDGERLNEMRVRKGHPIGYRPSESAPWFYAACLPGADVTHWQRGFPAAVSLPWQSWAAHADDILAAAPVTEVTLTTPPDFHVGEVRRRERVHGDEFPRGATTIVLDVVCEVAGKRERFQSAFTLEPDFPVEYANAIETHARRELAHATRPEALLSHRWPRIPPEGWHLPAGGFEVPREFTERLLRVWDQGVEDRMLRGDSVPVPLGVINARRYNRRR